MFFQFSRYVNSSRSDNSASLRNDGIRIQSDNKSLSNRLRRSRRSKSRGSNGRRKKQATSPRRLRLTYGSPDRRRDQPPKFSKIIKNTPTQFSLFLFHSHKLNIFLPTPSESTKSKMNKNVQEHHQQ